MDDVNGTGVESADIPKNESDPQPMPDGQGAPDTRVTGDGGAANMGESW